MSLHSLVTQLRYKPGWRFALFYGNTTAGHPIFIESALTFSSANVGSAVTVTDQPVTFAVEAAVQDSGDPSKTLHVHHTFGVPMHVHRDDAYWRYWLLCRILDVERHEAMEYFRIGKDRPFFPQHGDPNTIYAIRDRTPV
jgi:hypothetical protein